MPYFEIRVGANNYDYPPLIDISSFLYDFNLVYEISRLATDQEHKGYRFSEDTWSQEHRPITPDQQLHIITLRQESPLLLVAAVTAIPAAIGAIWGLVQVIDKIANWPLNRQILQLQRDKLAAELRKMQIAAPHDLEFPNIEEELEKQGGGFILEETVERLTRSPVRVREFEIEIVQKLPPKRRDRRDSPAR
jgi:hypothetical protein